MLIPLIFRDLMYGFDRAPIAVIVNFLGVALDEEEDKLMLILSKNGLPK